MIREVRRLPEDVKNAFENEVDLLVAIWLGVSKHLAPLWRSKVYEKSEGETYPNQLIQKAAAVIPALQRAIKKVCETGTIAIDDSDNSKSLEESVYEYIKQLPLELFYCRWTKSSITNDNRIEELANLIIKTRRLKKVPYDDCGGWFLEPESVELYADKLRLEREAKKRSKRATKPSRGKAKVARRQNKRSPASTA